MAAWATRAVFVVAMLLPILVGLWLYTAVLSSPLGTLYPQPGRTPTPISSGTGTAPTAEPPSGVTIAGATPTPPLAEPATLGIAQRTPAVPGVPAPTMIAVPGSTADPVATVQAFYRHISQGELDAAAELWSDEMKRRFPPDENIKQRFSQTRTIRLEEAQLASLSADGESASVVVQIVEVHGTPPEPQRFSGSWALVRGTGVWLMDRPALERR